MPTAQPTRVFELLYLQLERYPKPDCLAAKVDGAWQKLSTQEVVAQAERLALGLMAAGVQPQERVAIVATNRPEWVISDYAIQLCGAVSVPLYPTITVEDYRFILQDAAVKIVLCGSEDLYQKCAEAVRLIGVPPVLYTFDRVAGAPHWSELSAKANEADRTRMQAIQAAVRPQDLFTLIYTSGTTGQPKGVMLTHRNLIANIESTLECMPVDERSRSLSFLPLCHIYERMVMGIYVRFGVSVYFAESMDTIGANLKEVCPNLFTTVPRLLEKVYDRIVSTGYTLTGVKRALFFWALNLGLRYEPGKRMGTWYDMQLNVANRLVFSKWRAALGGNIVCIVSGAAALQPRLVRVFRAAQIAVMEGYGLTETSPVVSVNRRDEWGCRVGTVGPVVKNVEVKIAVDGEILVRGESVFAGYWHNEAGTAEVMDAEGYFHTGDIGTLSADNFLAITDRKKEIFKTSGGKYVAPQMIENMLKESLVIEQAMVVGEGRRFPAALLVPAYAGLRDWCKIKGIPYTTDAEMLTNAAVAAKYQTEVDRVNERLAQYEKIKKFTLLPHPWTIEAGEITPKLSLRRKIILAHNDAAMEEMYRE